MCPNSLPIRVFRAMIVLALVCGAGIVVRADQNMSGKQGAYDLQIRGFLTGQGQANVTPKHVHIKANCVDDSGNTVSLNLNVKTDDQGRFSQVVSIDSGSLTIQGRVDPAGTVVKTPRITCTYRTSGNQYGRIVGHQ